MYFKISKLSVFKTLPKLSLSFCYSKRHVSSLLSKSSCIPKLDKIRYPKESASYLMRQELYILKG